MNISAPPFAIYSAIIAAMLMPLVLFVIGKVAPEDVLGKRFFYAILSTFLAWLLALIAHFKAPFLWYIIIPDIIAGMLFYITGVLGVFCAWSLLAYGYTISMLATSARFEGEFNKLDWMNNYAAGQGLNGFFKDRLRVLEVFQLIEIRGTEIFLFKYRYFGRVVLLAMSIFCI